MITKLIIIFSIILQSVSFADSIILAQCNMLKIAENQCCKSPKTCCCTKAKTCKCSIKKPIATPTNKKDCIFSKISVHDDILANVQKPFYFVQNILVLIQKFNFNFNLKTYQEYINLPLLA